MSHEKFNDPWLWMLATIAALNLGIVIIRIEHNIARHGDPVILMSLFTMLVAVVLIFVCYLRVSIGLRKLSQQIESVLMQRLQLATFTMAVFGYVGMQSSGFHS